MNKFNPENFFNSYRISLLEDLLLIDPRLRVAYINNLKDILAVGVSPEQFQGTYLSLDDNELEELETLFVDRISEMENYKK